ncbi:HAD-IA family hydrolase [Longimicrobium sp.]|uniref:HAD-IA family hydrolase n=1 Tax=Longimicrobium sp. TaxID=2029185 RepID=UPI002C0B626A|nr:HAD-IA family hydrolase [Longimicrobium sp.]HSU17256.1 HAD-IA family hydrolase [Longimicrobium sp.]
MKAVLFDVGNTLLWLDHPFVIETLREHGVAATEGELIAAQYGAKLLLDELVRTGRAGDDATRGRVFFAEVFRQLGIGDELFPSIAQRLYARHAERNLWCSVRERTAETLEELRRRGWRLGVISNADGRVEALLQDVGLRDHFEFVIDSGSVGVEKPDPRIFRMALERMGIEPHDAVYVGDVYEIDVAGARAAGMRAILLDPLSRLGHLDCDRVAALHELPDRLAEAA